MRAEEQRIAIEGSLAEFVPYAFSQTYGLEYAQPDHLEPLLDALKRAFAGERVRFGFSVPPQHGKTETIVAACAQQILKDPRSQLGFASYVATKAHRESMRMMSIVEKFDGQINKGSRSRGDWLTTRHGGVKAAGLDHGFTGRPFGIVVVDDPYDGRKQANSPVHREAVEVFIKETLEPRCHAIILVHTRWHSDDAIGKRLKDPRWQIVNLAAECDVEGDALGRSFGQVLWEGANALKGVPEEQWFAKEKEDIFVWSSLYQGRPRPKGGALFGPATYLQGPRPRGLKVGVGLDFAYTEKTQSDWSVAVVLGKEPDTVGVDVDPVTKLKRRVLIERGPTHVLRVLRRQLKADAFSEELKGFLSPWPGVPCYAYLYGPELGTADHMRKGGRNVRVLTKPGDKFSRAQSCAAAWDKGLVPVPEGEDWVEEFVEEVTSFTGMGSGKKDQVDALVAGFDALDINQGLAEVFGDRRGAAAMEAFGGGRALDPQQPLGGIPTGGANGAVLPYETGAAPRNAMTWRGRGNGF